MDNAIYYHYYAYAVSQSVQRGGSVVEVVMIVLQPWRVGSPASSPAPLG